MTHAHTSQHHTASDGREHSSNKRTSYNTAMFRLDTYISRKFSRKEGSGTAHANRRAAREHLQFGKALGKPEEGCREGREEAGGGKGEVFGKGQGPFFLFLLLSEQTFSGQKEAQQDAFGKGQS